MINTLVISFMREYYSNTGVSGCRCGVVWLLRGGLSLGFLLPLSDRLYLCLVSLFLSFVDLSAEFSTHDIWGVIDFGIVGGVNQTKMGFCYNHRKLMFHPRLCFIVENLIRLSACIGTGFSHVARIPENVLNTLEFYKLRPKQVQNEGFSHIFLARPS